MEVNLNNKLSFPIKTFQEIHGKDLDDECLAAQSAISGFNALTSLTWAIEANKQARKSGQLFIDSPFTGSPVFCIGSYVNRDHNYLLFADAENSEKIILCQYVANTMAASLSKKIILQLTEVTSWAEESRKHFNDSYDNLLTIFEEHGSQPASYGGMSVNQARPYHYFYDYMYGLELIMRGYDDDPISAYSCEGFGFLDLSDVFNQIAFCELNQRDLNSLLLGKGQFLLAPCIQYFKHDFADKLLSVSRILCNASAKSQLSPDPYNLKNNTILWIGISSEKRSWKQQCEGFAQIINSLASDYPDLAVVVDGRTFPLKPTLSDLTIKSRDDKIFAAIREKVFDTPVYSLIGLNALQKISVARKVSAFVTHVGTDSLYPSAICKKPGIAYCPNAMQEITRQLHIHENTRMLDKRYISDIVDQSTGSVDPWYISVSIDWKIIYQECKALLDLSA